MLGSTRSLTKLPTMILDSPLPAAGPLGTAPFAGAVLAPLVFLWMPPAGVAVAAFVPFPTRRPARPRRPAVLRRVLRISSRLWSSFPDMLKWWWCECLSDGAFADGEMWIRIEDSQAEKADCRPKWQSWWQYRGLWPVKQLWIMCLQEQGTGEGEDG